MRINAPKVQTRKKAEVVEAKPLTEQLQLISAAEEVVRAEKALILRKALESDDPAAIVTANKLLQNVEPKEDTPKKSVLFDPNSFINSFGFKDKSYSLSYRLLEKMSNIDIINAIRKTRKNQVAAFLEPQSDKYSSGFVIRKKKRYFAEDTTKLRKEEEAKIEELTEFILNCGDGSNQWEGDDFDTFGRKFIDDSLRYDQATFEIVNNRKGMPCRFFVTDATTFRLAETYDDDEYRNAYRQYSSRESKRKVMGYLPKYVQVIENKIIAEYYPWELCFAVRNANSSIYNHGYGISECEDLITTLTYWLWSEEYNANQFKEGAFPKGLLRIKGGNTKTVEDFKQQFLTMIKGVRNSWKTAIVDSESAEWVDMEKRGRDLEYGKWMDVLLKISCAHYTIDPSEINFFMNSGSNDKAPMFGENQGERLKFSRDKGLYPLLRFKQRKLNKYVIQRLDPKYELAFVGMDGMTMKDEIENDIKLVTNIFQLNEIRKKWGLKAIEGGDIVLNGAFLQGQQMQMQKEMMEQQNQNQGNAENPEEEQGAEGEDGENPFMKDLQSYIDKTLA